MVLLRKTLFYIFLLIFLVGAPMLVIYALGYFFDPEASQTISMRGIIYLDSIPRGAQIQLGKKRLGETPREIRDLKPGEYELVVTQKGHHPWRERVPVIAGKATVLNKILLLPESLIFRRAAPGPWTGFYPVSDHSLLLVKDKRMSSLRVFESGKEGTEELQLESGTKIPEVAISEILNVSKDRPWFFKVEAAGEPGYWVIHPGFSGYRIQDISKLVGAEPERIGEDPGENRFLFTYREGTLGRIDLDHETVDSLFASGVRGFGFYEGSLYVLHQDGSILQMNAANDSPKAIFHHPDFIQSNFGEEGFYEIHLFPKKYVFFLGEDGRLAANRLPYQLISGGVRGIQFHPRNQELLVWKKDKIGVLRFPARSMDSAFFEPAPQLEWLYEGGDNIEQGFWVYEGSHILFRDGGKVFLTARKSFKARPLQLLFEVEPGTPIHYSERGGNVFFLSEGGRDLVSVEIFPTAQLGPLTVPNFEGFDLLDERP